MPDETPAGCSASSYNTITTAGSFNTWYQGKTSSLNTYNALTTAPTPGQTSDVVSITTEIGSILACLQALINGVGGNANSIFLAQEQILNLNDQITAEEANASIAKDRVGYIRHPEQNVSNYASWFPIDRPIHTLSLLIIMSISLFVSIFCIFMLFSFLGVSIVVYQPSSTNKNSMLYWLYSQFTTTTWVILIAFVSVLIYFLRR
jgi:hypothetical protein